MPSRTSLPTRKKILEMHAARMSIADIAEALNINRGTVAKYTRQDDAKHAITDAPAAILTAADIVRLKVLADLVVTEPCARCRMPMHWLRGTVSMWCNHCGVLVEMHAQAKAPKAR